MDTAGVIWARRWPSNRAIEPSQFQRDRRDSASQSHLDAVHRLARRTDNHLISDAHAGSMVSLSHSSCGRPEANALRCHHPRRRVHDLNALTRRQSPIHRIARRAAQLVQSILQDATPVRPPVVTGPKRVPRRAGIGDLLVRHAEPKAADSAWTKHERLSPRARRI
jgi:hypothetical protein